MSKVGAHPYAISGREFLIDGRAVEHYLGRSKIIHLCMVN